MSLTRREQFAMAAMQGLLAANYKVASCAEYAVKAADDLIAELDKTTSHGEGWTSWNGGQCPVAPDTAVEVKYRDGDKLLVNASNAWWGHYDIGGDIIAYRIVGDAA